MRQVALITGGARGIGRGIAEALARIDFDIVVDDVWEAKEAEQTVQALQNLGAEVLYVQADISKAEERARLVEACRARFGRLDLLVNNAGVAPAQRVDILEATEESFDRVLFINLKGPYFLTQAVAKWMIEQKQQDATRSPKIVNISSISAYASSPSRGEYCISKAGVSMMTILFADRLAQYGINVYEIRPGIIATDMTKAVKDKYDALIAQGLTPIARWGSPEDIGKAVAAIASGAFPFSTGEVINVDGGFHLRRL
ncbi:MAG: 3-ketoacyl-ACP reductase [bacterium]|jgi:NAD(P)-dependent dehydrogenase (short-subunit alcohol dehydrogenase family)|nr:3-ketoacyl-ACP reductase [candidate division KSB1 bacterium]MDH7559244.1 3-ketoacyl-ACP reductase [bacterium]